MGRKCIEIKTLHGFTIDELQEKVFKVKKEYTRSVLQTVIMRYNGIKPATIARILGKSHATITIYINNWNNSPDSIIDNRGGNIPSKLTKEIVENIENIVVNNTPRDFGYDQSNWTTALLAKYIDTKYGYKYSDEWIRLLLKSLGFTYKKGVYKPTKADAELQESFKKNVTILGYF